MPHCTACGAPADEADEYCAQCGNALTNPADATPAATESTQTEPQPATAAPTGGGQAPDGQAGTRSRQAGPTRPPRPHGSPPTPHPDGRARPDGLKLVCAVIAIIGLQTAIGSVALFQAQSVLGPTMGGGGFGATGGLLVLLGGAYLVAAYGLWTGTGWAWTVTIGVLAVGALVQLLAPMGSGLPVLSALASGGLAVYLWTAGERFRPALRPNAAIHG